MIIPISGFEMIIQAAFIAGCTAPVILITLFVRDWIKGEIW